MDDKLWIHAMLGGVCSVEGCGETDHRCLHVDHIDWSANPVKSNGAFKNKRNGSGWDQGLGDALKRQKAGEDITKDFQLLCAKHHAIKTYEERKQARRCSYQLELSLEIGDGQLSLLFLGGGGA